MKRSYYSVGGQVIAERTPGGGRTDYGADALGSVTATAAAGGTASSRYSPYGEQGSAPAGATLGWAGSWGYRPTARSVASHYIRARHYASPIGQWTSVDRPTKHAPSMAPQIPRSSNAYYDHPIDTLEDRFLSFGSKGAHTPIEEAELLSVRWVFTYALVNPITYVDPDGHVPIAAFLLPRQRRGVYRLLLECRKKQFKVDCFVCAYRYFKEMHFNTPYAACQHANTACRSTVRCGPLGAEVPPKGANCFSIWSYAHELRKISDKMAHCWAACALSRCWGTGWVLSFAESDVQDIIANEYGLECSHEGCNTLDAPPPCLECCARKTSSLDSWPQKPKGL
jgi:hypothetical protein